MVSQLKPANSAPTVVLPCGGDRLVVVDGVTREASAEESSKEAASAGSDESPDRAEPTEGGAGGE